MWFLEIRPESKNLCLRRSMGRELLYKSLVPSSSLLYFIPEWILQTRICLLSINVLVKGSSIFRVYNNVLCLLWVLKTTSQLLWGMEVTELRCMVEISDHCFQNAKIFSMKFSKWNCWTFSAKGKKKYACVGKYHRCQNTLSTLPKCSFRNIFGDTF